MDLDPPEDLSQQLKSIFVSGIDLQISYDDSQMGTGKEEREYIFHVLALTHKNLEAQERNVSHPKATN